MNMKIALVILLLALVPLIEIAQQSRTEPEPAIVAGKGWGEVAMGNKRTVVESVLGSGVQRSNYDDDYFYDYPEKGIQVSYLNKDDTVDAIFFYNKQHRYEHFATASVKTDNGIDWNSSAGDVVRAYGKPAEDYSGLGWRRIVFDGIDFRFENGVMVRIGIPGK